MNVGVNINTTKTMSVASNAFAKEIKDTKDNLLKKCEALGMDVKNIVKNYRINRTIDPGDDVLTISINGTEMWFKRGEAYNLPADVAAFLENIGE